MPPRAVRSTWYSIGTRSSSRRWSPRSCRWTSTRRAPATRARGRTASPSASWEPQASGARTCSPLRDLELAKACPDEHQAVAAIVSMDIDPTLERAYAAPCNLNHDRGLVGAGTTREAKSAQRTGCSSATGRGRPRRPGGGARAVRAPRRRRRGPRPPRARRRHLVIGEHAYVRDAAVPRAARVSAEDASCRRDRAFRPASSR